MRGITRCGALIKPKASFRPRTVLVAMELTPSPVAVSRFVAVQTDEPRHRETTASKFPVSATAKSASTNLPRRDVARRRNVAPLQDETIPACGSGSPREVRQPWDANHAQANNPLALQIQP